MTLEGYPKQLTLRGGTQVLIKPMTVQDSKAVHEFFRELPEEDRQYLRDDVMSQDWIDRFVRSIDYETVIPIIAEHEEKVIGNGTLYRSRYGWTKHVAEIRVSVSREFQHKGLGTALARILLRHAISLGLEKMIAHVMDNQLSAKRAFEKLGFKEEAVLKGQVKDIFGMKRDLVVLSNDVSHLWDAMSSLVSDYKPALE